jgi:molecular chaperone DnaJ
MNKKEAYEILELTPGATPEDIKKKYRQLTKKFHPDVNKEPGATERFQKINLAHEILTGKVEAEKPVNFNPFSNPFNNPFNMDFGAIRVPQHIELSTRISFKESVLGCKKELKYSRFIKCKECNGVGEKTQNNGCDKCGGRGQVINKKGNIIISMACDKCRGRMTNIPCDICQTEGGVNAEVSINVVIPGGVVNGNVLRLAGMGNYIGINMFGDQCTDCHLKINVEKDLDLTLIDQDVVSYLNISLFEAVLGCKKQIKTIDGEKEIEINKLSKNKDEIIVPKMGVNGMGNQRVILDVEYPNNIEELIGVK